MPPVTTRYVVPSRKEILERRARKQRHPGVERDNSASASSSDDEESGKAIDLLKIVEKDMAVNQENVREAERLIEDARRNRHSRRGGSERSAGDEQAGAGPVPPVGDSSDSEEDIKKAGGGDGPGRGPERAEAVDGAVPERDEESAAAVPDRDEEGAGTVYQSDEDRDEDGAGAGPENDEDGAGTVYQSDEDRDEDGAGQEPDLEPGPQDGTGGEKESTGDGDGIPVAGDDTGRSRDEVKWIMLRAALKRSSENLVNEYLPSQSTLTKQGIAGLLSFLVPVLMSRLQLADEDQKDREIESLTSFIRKWETRSAGWRFWSRLEIR
jgi:hypothetical protein